MNETRPGPLTLAGFLLIALIGGSNVVAVRLSNRELDPLWGAGSRFAAASLLLFAVAIVARVELPRGRALLGAVLFGALNFFGFFSFGYYGLQHVPSAVGGTMIGLLPLITLGLAVVQRVEAFHLRALVGAVIAVSGVVVMVGAPGETRVPILSLLSMLVAVVCAAEASIIVKRFPPMGAIALNAVSMPVGAVMLLITSAVAGETWALPHRTTTWLTLAYITPVGSVALFVIFVFVLNRWTATAVSYQFVLFPIVAALVGAWVAGEPLSASIGIGAVLAMAGLYVGALAPARKAAAPVEPAA